MGTGFPVGPHQETTEAFETQAFSDVTLPERLLNVSVRVDGPPDFEWTEVDVEHRLGDEWFLVGTVRFEAAEGELRLIDGRTNGGDAPAVVDDGERYRIVLGAATELDSALTYVIDAAFSAYDTEPC